MAPKIDLAVRLGASGICRNCTFGSRRSLASGNTLGKARTSQQSVISNTGHRLHSSSAKIPTAFVATTNSATASKNTASASTTSLHCAPTSVNNISTRSISSSACHRREMLANIPDELLPKPKLEADNLFHSFSSSPIPEIRQRAEYIKHHAYCPEHSHRPMWAPTMAPQPEAEPKEPGTADPKHPSFECPDCGIPLYCSEQHWMEDYENHMQVCDTLRQINEDAHDLHSGRAFPEFAYSGVQIREAIVNMSDWDNYMYSRDFEAVNSDRSMRHITRLLTYPVTIGSVLHELSPYTIQKNSRLTTEGLKSLSALRYSLHPPKRAGEKIKDLKLNPPAMRIFVLGARAESSLPREAWTELSHLFPDTRLHVIMIGPESMSNRDDEFPLPPRTPENPYGAIVEDRIWTNLKISTIVDYYHTIHKTGYFEPYDPYFDCFVLFHPGLGYPTTSPEWAETLPQLLETKLPIICTGYTQYDMERDIEWVNKTAKGEFDILLKPGENKFRSLGWEMNDLDPKDIHCRNWGVWAFRGKRYEATTKEDGTIAL
ncbi:Protein MSS51, mitochondrial [Ceratocystis fimbriata CBS 114723]|uniref:Protein MSS51, mitochondrial n=1 Tax=Ceratocystis fimbriata CBS 114723 TaxID=1035309 RepID=A0A2C5X9X0_9PEZI|nr:Protein MSS51, mitochondrial [Ceratocystis fimbriata CBS 114723]